MLRKLKWKIAQMAEIKWWKNYLKDKDKQQYLEWKKNYWQNILEKLNDVIEINSSQRILDAGCGPAGIFIKLQHCKTIAIDPLLDEYERDLDHFKKKAYPSIQFITSPLEQIHLSEKMDLIFCMNAINHVEDLNICYDKLVSLLKPGGKLIISIDCHNHGFLKKIFRLIPGDILHPYQFDLLEYEKFLTDRKLDIIKNICIKKEFFFSHYIQIAVAP
jgi:2-polyprenyl-6-hydroxyphenyl methylase/3-demethylubiquinone-9 3-methyltransferase